VAEGMKAAVEKHGQSGVALLVSPRVTNETALQLLRMGQKGLGTSNVGSYGLAPEAGVFGALERSFGRPASTASYEDVRNAGAVLLLDSDIAEEQTVLSLSVRRAARNGASLIVVSPEETRMTKMADIWIQAGGRELSNVLLAMAGQALDAGADPSALPFEVRGLDELKKLAESSTVDAAVTGGSLHDAVDALVKADRAVVVANTRSFDPSVAGRDAALAVAVAAVTSSAGSIPLVLFARTRANGQGLSDLGIERESAGVARELAAGAIRAAIIVGEDPISGADEPERVREQLSKLDFLVVADTVPTATTELADVVLPLAAPGESEGSYTSSERRVQAVAGPLAPPGGVTDLEMVAMLAAALGLEPGSVEASAVRAELADEVNLPGFPAGALPPDGVRWGGEALYEGGLSTPDGALDLSIPSVEAPDVAIDPRWTDSVEIRFSRLVEEAGLRPHVVRRHRVSA